MVCQTIDDAAVDLHHLSRKIWENPELANEEFFAHDLLTDYLGKCSFSKVDRKYLLETGFRATYGDGGPHVAVLCEYDALPGLGHACGHNLIAEVGIATGIAVRKLLETKKTLGRVRNYRREFPC